MNADTIIFVGDVVDRGKENAKVVNFIAEHKGNIHLICGNHEYQHRQLLKYYRALAKAPAIRKMAAGIFRHYTPEGRVIRDKSEIERLHCDEEERRKEIEKHPKTFEEWQKQFLIYTLAWEDDSLWKIVLYLLDEMTTEMRENANGKEYFPDIFHASSSVIADIFEACGIDLPDYVRILYYNDYMGDESIGRAAIEKIELAWQADPSKFRVDKKQNRLIYTYPQDGPWYELKYIADELPNSLEAEISGGNQLIMNYEQAQELFGIKFRRWLGIFNL